VSAAGFDELRNVMAHGWLSLTTDRQNYYQFEFLRYQREGDGKFVLLSATTTVERLRQAADDITAYVSDTHALFKRIYADKKLEG
jgi:hypothetical protein